MKKMVFLLGLVFVFALAGCAQSDTGEADAEIAYVSLFDTTDVDEILQYSSHVVKATLCAVNDFDGICKEYLFEVETDYIGNAPDEIHAYDAYNVAYVIGHSYYLALQGHDNALYPHTIYSSVAKDLVLDATSGQIIGELNQQDVSLTLSDIPDVLSSAVAQGIVGTALPPSAEAVSYAAADEEIDSQADVIARVRFVNEDRENPYVSMYQVEVAETLKGRKDSAAQFLFLSPGLELNRDYYLFLKEDPSTPGAYLPAWGNESVVLIDDDLALD